MHVFDIMAVQSVHINDAVSFAIYNGTIENNVTTTISTATFRSPHWYLSRRHHHARKQNAHEFILSVDDL